MNLSRMPDFMKRILVILFALLFIAGCDSSNRGYGYNTSEKKDSSYESRFNARTMRMYGLDGKAYNYCYAWRGEYDGHSWYIFRLTTETLTVVHDPKCKCMQ